MNETTMHARMAENTAAIEAVRKNSLRKMGDDKNASAKYSNDSMMKMDGVSNTSAINTGNIETRNNGDINMTLLLPLQLLLATRKETRIKTKQHQQKLNI